MQNNLKPGVYRHYKGGRYYLKAIAYLEASGEEMAVYESMQEIPKLGGYPWFVRPAQEFAELLTVDGLTIARFTFEHE